MSYMTHSGAILKGNNLNPAAVTSCAPHLSNDDLGLGHEVAPLRSVGNF